MNYKPIIIVADPPAEGMVFDRWVGNAEPQYFEGVDQWYHSSEYIDDIYSPTTFVTRLGTLVLSTKEPQYRCFGFLDRFYWGSS